MRRYLYKIRPSRGRVYQEVIYEPGEVMQVDWGECGRLEIGQTPRRVSVFVAVLCYSRLCYIEFSLSQRKADFYRALVHALEFYHGSPRKIILDNLKAAVLSGSGRYACLHPEFLALCGHFCMEPIACARRDPESKGIVEGGVRYVKCSALAGRREELVTWDDYRRLAPQWRDEVANVRLHAATKERPIDRFQKERGFRMRSHGNHKDRSVNQPLILILIAVHRGGQTGNSLAVFQEYALAGGQRKWLVARLTQEHLPVDFHLHLPPLRPIDVGHGKERAGQFDLDALARRQHDLRRSVRRAPRGIELLGLQRAELPRRMLHAQPLPPNCRLVVGRNQLGVGLADVA